MHEPCRAYAGAMENHVPFEDATEGTASPAQELRVRPFLVTTLVARRSCVVVYAARTLVAHGPHR
jgi:hypothetical protein